MNAAQPAGKPPVFDKVIVASIVAAVTPTLLRVVFDQTGILVDDDENTRRVLVTLVTGVLTFAAAWLKSEPRAKVQRYLNARRGGGGDAGAGSTVQPGGNRYEPPATSPYADGGPQEPTRHRDGL